MIITDYTVLFAIQNIAIENLFLKQLNWTAFDYIVGRSTPQLGVSFKALFFQNENILSSS